MEQVQGSTRETALTPMLPLISPERMPVVLADAALPESSVDSIATKADLIEKVKECLIHKSATRQIMERVVWGLIREIAYCNPRFDFEHPLNSPGVCQMVSTLYGFFLSRKTVPGVRPLERDVEQV